MAKLMHVISKLLTAIFNSLWTFPPQTPQPDRGQRFLFFLMLYVSGANLRVCSFLICAHLIWSKPVTSGENGHAVTLSGC